MKKLILAAAFLISTIGATAQSVQCKGIKKDGTQCLKKTKSPSGYCSIHNPGKIHCAGTKKNGAPCRNLAKKGSLYCRYHGKK